MLKNRRCPLVFRVIFFVAALIPEATQAESTEAEVEGRLTEVQVAEEGHLRIASTASAHRGIASVAQNELHSSPGTHRNTISSDSQSHTLEVPKSTSSHTNSDAFPRPKFETSPSEKGTLTGSISSLSGNFIGTRSDSTSSITKHPLNARVFVFNGKLKALGHDHYAKSPTEALQDPRLATVIVADNDGKYEVKLSPGTYTVLAEINGKLYKNSYDGLGFYSTIEVTAGQESQEVIADNSAVNY